MDGLFYTPCPVGMLVFRIISAAFLSFLGIYQLFDYGAEYFIYMTSWGVILTATFFTLILVHGKFPHFESVLSKLIPAMWILNVFITLFYWIFLSRYYFSLDSFDTFFFPFFNHTAPVVSNTIEVFLDQIPGNLMNTLYGIGIFVAYIVLINLPYTLLVEEVYPDINYTNWYTYLCAIGSLAALAVLGYILYISKKKIMEKRSGEGSNYYQLKEI